jgi:hypothetical protein
VGDGEFGVHPRLRTAEVGEALQARIERWIEQVRVRIIGAVLDAGETWRAANWPTNRLRRDRKARAKRTRSEGGSRSAPFMK